MSGGSQQLRRFRIAVRAGRPVEEAAALAGICVREARLIVADDMKNPPAPEAYVPLASAYCASCGASLCGCTDALWLGIAA